MSTTDSKYPGNSLISGGRLVELVMVAVCSAAISGGITALVATSVLKEQLASQQRAIEDVRLELRELRRDIYRPDWRHEGNMLELDPADLIAELHSSLHAAASFFHGEEDDPDADFRRHLRIAAADLATQRGNTLLGEVELVAGQSEYTGLPAQLIYIKSPLWGTDRHIHPWADNHPGPLPRPRLYENAAGERRLLLTPAPTHRQIQVLGSQYRFFYGASYWDGEMGSTIRLDAYYRDLLLMRAQAEACRELAMQNMTKPVETRTSLSQPRGDTPRALWEALIAHYEQRLGVAA